MPHLQFNDAYYDHPETQLRSFAAGGLMAKALTYCSRQLTDGFIPGETMRTLMRGRGGKQAFEELQLPTAAGPHWIRMDGDGFRVDRYLDPSAPWGRQRSRAQVERDREKAAARKEQYERRNAQSQLHWNGAGEHIEAKR